LTGSDCVSGDTMTSGMEAHLCRRIGLSIAPAARAGNTCRRLFLISETHRRPDLDTC
jgi:hypothetical protein